jgi:hypothetical protein
MDTAANTPITSVLAVTHKTPLGRAATAAVLDRVGPVDGRKAGAFNASL